MGLFRVIVKAVEPGDECWYDTAPRGTLHGSKAKKMGSRLGAKDLERTKKPDGLFFSKGRRHP
jgi:hypothetical protein